ncbi:MAG: multicopper oxidase family protein [Treponema sp.]|nr:multicopper oxidase family protein [Treponema sp.]
MKKLFLAACAVMAIFQFVACTGAFAQERVGNAKSGATESTYKNYEGSMNNPFNIISVAPASQFHIAIEPGKQEIVTGRQTNVNNYATGFPGGAIITAKNTNLTINVTSTIDTVTSMHWHGLKVVNDQDGPFTPIQPGGSAAFQFSLAEAGTFWYHPHHRPILPQLNSGMYAPFIVKETYDTAYAGDYILMLDDWALSPEGTIDDRYTIAHMEIVGSVETVNKRTGEAIYPVELKKGEIVKLRFINASTAQLHTLHLDGHEFTVTHLDGHPLTSSFTTRTITLFPGERADVELKGIHNSGTFYIVNERNFGMRIPVVYTGAGRDMQSPFVPPQMKAFPGIADKAVDLTYVLASRMSRGGGGRMGGGRGMMGGRGSGGMRMEWTINGLAHPNIPPTRVNVGQVYKIRFVNNDRMMMTQTSHPMHIHGEHFLVVSVNGTPPPSEMWLDTVEIPIGQYVDVAIRFDNPGTWMMHCHIIDHEDNGMLTVIIAE